jgi:hypothetical protein
MKTNLKNLFSKIKIGKQTATWLQFNDGSLINTGKIEFVKLIEENGSFRVRLCFTEEYGEYVEVHWGTKKSASEVFEKIADLLNAQKLY